MNSLRTEQGQVLVLAAAGFFLVVLVALAVVLDVGWWLHDKRDAQNDVDATVLAGARELPDEGTARALAEAWASRNGVTSGDLNCCQFEDLSGDGAADLIRARVEREPGSLAGSLLDIGIVTIAAEAAAAKQRAIGSCVIPWAVAAINDDPTVKYGLDDSNVFVFHLSGWETPGNFGALAIYGNGDKVYRESIEQTCGGEGVEVCDTGESEPVVYEGDALPCDPQTGNLGQTTNAALTNRYGDGLEAEQCDVTTLTDAYTEAASSACEDRKVMIPIIDTWPEHGHSNIINIYGVAVFYIAGWDRDPPYGDADADGDTISDEAMAWGYFLEDEDVTEVWNIKWGYSNDPFAPTKVLLVE